MTTIGKLIGVIAVLLTTSMACSTATKTTGDYKIALTPSRSGQHGIFVMKSDTTGGKLLSPEPSAQLRATSWSPDGGKIAFLATPSKDSRFLSGYGMPFHYLVYSINPGGRSAKRLLDFPISSFDWSPDGRKLLYISAYEDPQHDEVAVLRGTKIPMSAVYILDLGTGERKRLTSFGKNCSGAWSPDGALVALSFGTEQKSDIYTASPDGEHIRRLTDSKTISMKPAWSPDGKSIAYISIPSQGTGDQDGGVYLMDATGENKRHISSIIASGAAWSPDGKMLLLQSAAGFILTDLNGKKPFNPIPQIGRPMEAQFTPDGKEIAFRSDHEGEWRLYAVQPDGSNMRRITGKLSAATYCLSPLLSKQ